MESGVGFEELPEGQDLGLDTYRGLRTGVGIKDGVEAVPFVMMIFDHDREIRLPLSEAFNLASELMICGGMAATVGAVIDATVMINMPRELVDGIAAEVSRRAKKSLQVEMAMSSAERVEAILATALGREDDDDSGGSEPDDVSGTGEPERRDRGDRPGRPAAE